MLPEFSPIRTREDRYLAMAKMFGNFKISTLYFYWQLIPLLAIFWVITRIPYLMVVGHPLLIGDLVLSLGASFIFFLDAWINFKLIPRTSSTRSINREEAVPDSYPIFWRVVDLLSIAPFFLTDYFYFGELKWSLLNLICALKVVRVYGFFDNQAEYFGIENRLKWPVLILSSMAFVHIIGCGGIGFGIVEKQSDFLTLYNIAVYWAVTTLTTIGYGDVTPHSNLARSFTMVIEITGVAVYGVVIGNVSRFFLESDRHKQATKEKLQDLALFMRHYSVPDKTQKEVFRFYNHMVKKRLSDNDTKMISELPHALQKELQIYMKSKLIRDIPFFKQTPTQCLLMTAQKLEQAFFSPGDSIIKKGDVGHEMFIIGHGEVEVLIDEKKVIATLHDGEFFGEVALLKETNRTADVVAKSYCDVYRLDKESFNEIVGKFPALGQEFENMMHKRAAV